ncbi:MAG TPA: hypothetical protein PLO96_07945, partial [Candidatus Cloacimonas acidaminovorans]|nr:hypothetical protein [Candidatus Cloacimonas acidaminovorans]
KTKGFNPAKIYLYERKRVSYGRQILTTGFNPVKSAKETTLSLLLRMSSVGTTDTNNGFQPGEEKYQIAFISFP